MYGSHTTIYKKKWAHEKQKQFLLKIQSYVENIIMFVIKYLFCHLKFNLSSNDELCFLILSCMINLDPCEGRSNELIHQRKKNNLLCETECFKMFFF